MVRYTVQNHNKLETKRQEVTQSHATPSWQKRRPFKSLRVKIVAKSLEWWRQRASDHSSATQNWTGWRGTASDDGATGNRCRRHASESSWRRTAVRRALAWQNVRARAVHALIYKRANSEVVSYSTFNLPVRRVTIVQQNTSLTKLLLLLLQQDGVDVVIEGDARQWLVEHGADVGDFVSGLRASTDVLLALTHLLRQLVLQRCNLKTQTHYMTRQLQPRRLILEFKVTPAPPSPSHACGVRAHEPQACAQPGSVRIEVAPSPSQSRDGVES